MAARRAFWQRVPVPSTDIRPLPSWANAARLTFWTSWALVPLISILINVDVIDGDSDRWFALRVAVAVVWTLAGLTWASAEYKRRH